MKASDLRRDIFDNIRATQDSIKGCTDEQLNELLFLHPDTHRLNANGCVYVGNAYTPHFFPLTNKITPRQLLAIFRNIKWPFYINSKSLILFGKEDIFLLKLCGNDVDIWVSRLLS